MTRTVLYLVSALFWAGCVLPPMDGTRPSAAPRASRLGALERSVVRLVNYSQRGDWSSPWERQRVQQSIGSGFVVAGGLVMTNAHVVSDSRLLLMHLSNDPTPYEAEIVHIAHDCDLALVRPKDPSVVAGITALDFGERPELGSLVDTLGYPVGGLRLSSTRGVVSRIEQLTYVHSGADVHAVVQTDASINPGASGGPAFQDGKVVGVAFQADQRLENVGFLIPPEVVRRFLLDVADGSYDGYPKVGIRVESLEHPAARDYAGMAPGESGQRVYLVFRGSSADGRLQVGDVILAVNGRRVANDGSVVDGARRIPMSLLIDRMFLGQTVSFRILRDGERIDVEMPLRRFPNYDLRRNQYDHAPRYFVYGGLLFVPLSVETLRTYGQNWTQSAPRELVGEFAYRPSAEPDLAQQERVVLLRRLDHPVNSQIAWSRNQVVERVNGRDISSLETLIDAIERNTGDYHVLEFAHAGRFGVLDRREIEAANDEILALYGIERDRNL